MELAGAPGVTCSTVREGGMGAGGGRCRVGWAVTFEFHWHLLGPSGIRELFEVAAEKRRHDVVTHFDGQLHAGGLDGAVQPRDGASVTYPVRQRR